MQYENSYGTSMVSEIDTWRSAQAMLQAHGPEAASRASSRVRELLAAGDRDGAMTWLAIRRAIHELEKSAFNKLSDLIECLGNNERIAFQ